MKWQTKPLNQLGYVIRGKSRHRPRNAEFLYGGEYPFIQTADVKDADLYIRQYYQTYSEEGLAQSKLWKKGTMCITIAANIADTAILDIDACFPDSIIGFVADKELANVKFIKYFFDTIQESMRQASQGATQDNLSVEKLLTFNIASPPLKIQNKIANVLSSYDDLIENNLKRVKILDEILRIIYRKEYGEFQIGNTQSTILPNDWQTKTIGEIIGKLESGSRPKGGIDKELKSGIPSIGAENVIGLGKYNYHNEKFIAESFYEKMNRGKIEDKDILIYKDGAYIGKTSLFQDSFPHEKCCINEHVFLLQTENKNYQYFLFFTLNQSLYFEKMQQLNANAAQPGINQETLKSLKILWPTEDSVIKFNNQVRDIVKTIFVLAKQNHKLKEARSILLPRLMNGEIEV